MSALSAAHLALRAAVVRPLAARAHEAGRAAAHAAGALLGLGLVLGPLLARPWPAAAWLGEVVDEPPPSQCADTQPVEAPVRTSTGAVSPCSRAALARWTSCSSRSP